MKVEDHLGNSDHNVLRWNIMHTLKLKKDKKNYKAVSQGKLCWDEKMAWENRM
jgi:hypothetical protein